MYYNQTGSRNATSSIAAAGHSSGENNLTNNLKPAGLQRHIPSSSESIVSLDSNRKGLLRERRQHTLNSIGGQTSRSRSPIVAGGIDGAGGLFRQRSSQISCFGDIDPRMDQREDRLLSRSANNPFNTSYRQRISNGASHHQTGLPKSGAPNGVSELAELRPAKGASIATSGDNDDLSLEHILADIEAGRLQNLMSQSRPLENSNIITASRHDNQPAGGFVANSAISTATLSVSSSLSSLVDEVVTASELNSLDQSDSVINFSSRASKNNARERELATGFEIVWLNFTYTVKPNFFENPRWGQINKLFHKEKRMILKGLSGGVKSGQMVALMGPSGAGKTCLLECISGLRRTGITGKILLRGRKKAQMVIVPQYDNFMPQFSVEEIIIYGSKLKNPPETDHKAVANEMIKQFGLEVCRRTKIGKCSGGQRKRVAIAQELVSKPNILILDEPTSGLDSSCCYQTMRVLREVLDKSVQTNEPMAIITTIHQPSAKVFKMFDMVYLLGKTGYAAYSGEPSQLLATITELTGLQCPKYSNPSDYMIELVSYDYGEEPVEELIEFEKRKARLFVRDFELRANIKVDSLESCEELNIISGGGGGLRNNSIAIQLRSSKSDTQLEDKTKLQERNRGERLAVSSATSAAGHVNYKQNITVSLRKATSSSKLRHPFFWHLYIHFQRSFFQASRDPIVNNMRILIHIVFAYLLVILYGKKSGEARGCPPILGLPTEITDPDNEVMIDLADNVGYLFMCIMMITYVSLMTTVLTFPIDIKTVGKEYKNGWYGTLPYFLGKTIADLPFVIIYPIIYCTIVWKLTNQATDHSWRFGHFTILIILNAMNSQSFGLILGALFVNSVTAATFLGPVMTIPWYLFTGFTKRIHRLDEFYKFATKFLFTRIVFEGLLDTTYGHERCNCSYFLERYYELRYEEAVRLGQLVSVETLSSLDYYDSMDSFAPEVAANNSSPRASKWFEKTVDAATTVFADGEDLNLASLMETNVKASSLFSFGLDFEPTCPADYRNFIIQDFRLENNTSTRAIYAAFFMLIAIRVLTFIVVSWKIRTRQI